MYFSQLGFGSSVICETDWHMVGRVLKASFPCKTPATCQEQEQQQWPVVSNSKSSHQQVFLRNVIVFMFSL